MPRIRTPEKEMELVGSDMARLCKAYGRLAGRTDGQETTVRDADLAKMRHLAYRWRQAVKRLQGPR